MKRSVWKAPLAYQFRNLLFSGLIVWGILILLPVLFFLGLSLFEPGEEFSYGGTETASMIFCFVWGCTSWRDAFHLGLAGGVPRRVLYGSALACVAAMSILFAPISLLVTFLTGQLPTSDIVPMFAYIYGGKAQIAAPYADINFLLQGMVWQAGISLFLSCAGLFLGCLYYRISRWLRILLTIAIPVMLFVGVPTLLSFLPRDGVQELIRAALSMLENSWLTAGLCAVLGALFAVFGWISTRNAALMRNPQPSASAG